MNILSYIFLVLFLVFGVFLHKKQEKIMEFQMSIASGLDALHHLIKDDIRLAQGKLECKLADMSDANEKDIAALKETVGYLASASSSLNGVVDMVLDMVRESREEVIISDKPMMKVKRGDSEVMVEVDGEF